jgi:hypothetical protein
VSSSTTNHPEPEEQLQWLIERARDHEHAALKRTIVYCLIAVVVAGLVLGIIGWQIQADPNLTWAWLELLIIPTVLGAGAFWLNTQIRRSEQELARRERENDRVLPQDRAREDALQRYLYRMQELMLGKELETSAVEEIRYDSRKGTLAVLRILDGNRKGQVLKFLYESKLIGKPIREEAGDRWARGATIDLQTADLREAKLSGVDLRRADLSFADLRYANLNHANLRRADLFGVKGWTNTN